MGGKMNEWDELAAAERLALREGYGHYLDSLPPTCSMETKPERFRRWLGERGINFSQSG